MMRVEVYPLSTCVLRLALVVTVALTVSGCIAEESGQTHQNDATLHLSGRTQTPSQLVGFYLLDRRNTEPGERPAPGTIILAGAPGDGFRLPILAEAVRGRWNASISATSLPASAWASQNPDALAVSTSVGRIEIAAYPVGRSPTGAFGPVGPRLRTRAGGLEDDFTEADTFVAFDNDGVELRAAAVAT